MKKKIVNKKPIKDQFLKSLLEGKPVTVAARDAGISRAEAYT
jgi:hypothetical protein